MFFIVLGISVFAAVSGVLFISHWKFNDRKDYLYDETDSFGKRQVKDGTFKDRQSKKNQTKIPNGQLFLSFDKVEAKSSDCRGCRPVKETSPL
jgi:hypothetical protein